MVWLGHVFMWQVNCPLMSHLILFQVLLSESLSFSPFPKTQNRLKTLVTDILADFCNVQGTSCMTLSTLLSTGACWVCGKLSCIMWRCVFSFHLVWIVYLRWTVLKQHQGYDCIILFLLNLVCFLSFCLFSPPVTLSCYFLKPFPLPCHLLLSWMTEE